MPNNVDIEVEVEYESAELIPGEGGYFDLENTGGLLQVPGHPDQLLIHKPCSMPVVIVVTATYTGDDPGGVAEWEWCTDPDALVAAPSHGCPPPAESADDGTKAIFVQSVGPTQSVARIYYGTQVNPHHTPGGPAPEHFTPEDFGEFLLTPFFRVSATTDGGDVVTVNYKASSCVMETIEDGGRLRTAHELQCPKWRYEVTYKDAGPLVGGVPSDAGQIAIVRVIWCEADNDGTPPPAGEVDFDFNCCEGDGDGTPADPAAVRPCVPGGANPDPCGYLYGLTVAPPEAPEAWVDGRLTPGATNVLPGSALLGDGTYDKSTWPPGTADKHAGQYQAFEVPLGLVLTDLATTKSYEWDLGSVGPETTHYQDAATLVFKGAETTGERIGFGVRLGGPAEGSTNAQTRLQAVNTRLFITPSACSGEPRIGAAYTGCCECALEPNQAAQGRRIAYRHDGFHKITCSETIPPGGIFPPGTNYFDAWMARFVRDTDLEAPYAGCGEPLAVAWPYAEAAGELAPGAQMLDQGEERQTMYRSANINHYWRGVPQMGVGGGEVTEPAAKHRACYSVEDDYDYDGTTCYGPPNNDDYVWSLEHDPFAYGTLRCLDFLIDPGGGLPERVAISTFDATPSSDFCDCRFSDPRGACVDYTSCESLAYTVFAYELTYTEALPWLDNYVGSDGVPQFTDGRTTVNIAVPTAYTSIPSAYLTPYYGAYDGSGDPVDTLATYYAPAISTCFHCSKAMVSSIMPIWAGESSLAALGAHRRQQWLDNGNTLP